MELQEIQISDNTIIRIGGTVLCRSKVSGARVLLIRFLMMVIVSIFNYFFLFIRRSGGDGALPKRIKRTVPLILMVHYLEFCSEITDNN